MRRRRASRATRAAAKAAALLDSSYVSQRSQILVVLLIHTLRRLVVRARTVGGDARLARCRGERAFGHFAGQGKAEEVEEGGSDVPGLNGSLQRNRRRDYGRAALAITRHSRDDDFVATAANFVHQRGQRLERAERGGKPRGLVELEAVEDDVQRGEVHGRQPPAVEGGNESLPRSLVHAQGIAFRGGEDRLRRYRYQSAVAGIGRRPPVHGDAGDASLRGDLPEVIAAADGGRQRLPSRQGRVHQYEVAAGDALQDVPPSAKPNALDGANAVDFRAHTGSE